MAKISKKQAMLNTLLCNVIIAKSNYDEGKISFETLEVVYRQNYSFVMCHLSQSAFEEFFNNYTIAGLRELFKSA